MPRQSYKNRKKTWTRLKLVSGLAHLLEAIGGGLTFSVYRLHPGPLGRLVFFLCRLENLALSAYVRNCQEKIG